MEFKIYELQRKIKFMFRSFDISNECELSLNDYKLKEHYIKYDEREHKDILHDFACNDFTSNIVQLDDKIYFLEDTFFSEKWIDVTNKIK